MNALCNVLVAQQERCAREGRMPPRNIAGAPARGPDFWGREEDVKALWKLLERGSVLLTAPRRWGKSSLMFALHDTPWPAWSVLQMDVEYVETPAEFLTELTAALLQLDPVARMLRTARNLPGSLMRWLSSAIDEVGVGEMKLKLRESLTNAQAWPDLAEQLLEQLSSVEGSLLLIIDEFPMMVANFLERDAQSCVHFLKWFRAQRSVTGAHRRVPVGDAPAMAPAPERGHSLHLRGPRPGATEPGTLQPLPLPAEDELWPTGRRRAARSREADAGAGVQPGSSPASAPRGRPGSSPFG
jgi:hypothetical protein